MNPNAARNGPGVAPRPLWLGITGNIACGKSAVLAILADLGCATIDADAVYRDLVAPGSPLLAAIRQRFGPGVVAADGSLDRSALAAIVFAAPVALADLDALVRAPVVAEVLERARAVRDRPVAIDAVKLIESGLADHCDEVWVVTCSPATQLARLMARNRLDEVAARKRISAQAPVAAKIARADRIIDNDGPLPATRQQVERAFAEARTARERRSATPAANTEDRSP